MGIRECNILFYMYTFISIERVKKKNTIIKQKKVFIYIDKNEGTKY